MVRSRTGGAVQVTVVTLRHGLPRHVVPLLYVEKHTYAAKMAVANQIRTYTGFVPDSINMCRVKLK